MSMYGAAKRLSFVIVTASSFASPRDSSEWMMASASASSTSLPISVSKISGTGTVGSAANNVAAKTRTAASLRTPVSVHPWELLADQQFQAAEDGAAGHRDALDFL